MGRLSAVVLGALLTGAALAQTETEVIPLRSRLAEDVVPAIRPLAGPDGAVTTFGGQLIVRATPERLAEIRRVLDEIDRPPRRLVIHVRHRDAHEGAGRGAGVNARADLGDSVTVQTGPGRRGPGADIYLRDRRTLGESERSEGVQTIEGRPAFIRSGTAVPVPEWQSFGGGALPYVEQGVRYHDATAGFYVTPRLAGDEVVLEISQQVVRPDAGSPPTFAVQQAASTLRVRPGQWVSLAGVSGNAARSSRGIAGQYSTRRTEDTAIEVMVQVLPDR